MQTIIPLNGPQRRNLLLPRSALGPFESTEGAFSMRHARLYVFSLVWRPKMSKEICLQLDGDNETELSNLPSCIDRSLLAAKVDRRGDSTTVTLRFEEKSTTQGRVDAQIGEQEKSIRSTNET